jgi:hypothetical protein
VPYFTVRVHYLLQGTTKDLRNDCWCKRYSPVAQRIDEEFRNKIAKAQFFISSKKYKKEQQVAENGVTEREIMLSISCGA